MLSAWQMAMNSHSRSTASDPYLPLLSPDWSQALLNTHCNRNTVYSVYFRSAAQEPLGGELI